MTNRLSTRETENVSHNRSRDYSLIPRSQLYHRVLPFHPNFVTTLRV